MTDGDAPCECKVGRVAAACGLDGISEDLAAKWRGAEGEEHSLRDLRTYFNRRVLASRLRDASVEVLDGEIANTYRLLTDDDVSAGTRTQTENRLERNGVDVAALRKSFVSHQLIHTHLRECLGVEKESEATDSVASTRNTVGSLEARAEKIAANNLGRLADGEIALEGFDVIVTTHVTCDECGRRYEFGELLADGGCTCQME